MSEMHTPTMRTPGVPVRESTACESPASLPPAIAAAQALVADLVARGVRDVVLSPGSRSAPLAYALAAASDADEVRLHVRIDERVAGFLALGLAKGSAIAAGASGDPGRMSNPGQIAPVAVVVTSGTAVANLHPALLEAHHTGVPLIVLTADRPHELRGTGASQTTTQVGIFSSAVRFAADVPAPCALDSADREGELRDLAAVTARAVTAALGLRDRNPGLVHLNLAYREPLAPSAPLGGQDTPEQPTAAQTHEALPSGFSVPGGGPFPAARRTAVATLPAGSGSDPALAGDPACTLVVAGDGASPDAAALAAAQGWPLLAEPSSGCTHAGVAAHRILLGLSELTHDVRNVVVFGHPTLSRPVQRLLARPDVSVTVVAPGGGPWPDAARNAAAVVERIADHWLTPRADAGAQVPDVGDPAGLALPTDISPFAQRWAASGAAAARVLDRVLDGALSDPALGDVDAHAALAGMPHAGAIVARSVTCATRHGDVLVAGSSNPIRDLDLAGPALAPGAAVVANRGLAGIDGTTSTAVGVALASGRPTRVLVGDLTFLHDAGGLLRGPREPRAPLQIVVVNDDGGSIFATLEHGALAAVTPDAAATFERIFGTPHGADLASLAAAYGARYRTAPTLTDLRAALAAFGDEPGAVIEIVEVRVSRARRLADHEALSVAGQEAARQALAAL